MGDSVVGCAVSWAARSSAGPHVGALAARGQRRGPCGRRESTGGGGGQRVGRRGQGGLGGRAGGTWDAKDSSCTPDGRLRRPCMYLYLSLCDRVWAFVYARWSGCWRPRGWSRARWAGAAWGVACASTQPTHVASSRAELSRVWAAHHPSSPYPWRPGRGPSRAELSRRHTCLTCRASTTSTRLRVWRPPPGCDNTYRIV
jgi:hypothetical protein